MVQTRNKSWLWLPPYIRTYLLICTYTNIHYFIYYTQQTHYFFLDTYLFVYAEIYCTKYRNKRKVACIQWLYIQLQHLQIYITLTHNIEWYTATAIQQPIKKYIQLKSLLHSNSAARLHIAFFYSSTSSSTTS